MKSTYRCMLTQEAMGSSACLAASSCSDNLTVNIHVD
jgi:hypothetical protein